MKTIVRCKDRMVFEVDPSTLKPKTCSYYDAYCFSDPRPGVTYMSHSEWTRKLLAMMTTQMYKERT